MNARDLTHAFYVPGQPGIIDAVHPVTGRGVYGNRSLDEIRAEYPGAIVADWDTIREAEETRLRHPPEEVTKERFWYMLEVLPPVGWKHDADGGAESFKLSERTSGLMTAILCRIGERYFELQDVITMPHAEIVEKCREKIRELAFEAREASIGRTVAAMAPREETGYWSKPTE